MTRKLYGPADCGNQFGYWTRELVPAGHFAIVTDGELANGGFGPSSVDGKLYPTAHITSSSGAIYSLTEVRWEVRDEIEAELKAGQTTGKIDCGGQTYHWSVA